MQVYEKQGDKQRGYNVLLALMYKTVPQDFRKHVTKERHTSRHQQWHT